VTESCRLSLCVFRAPLHKAAVAPRQFELLECVFKKWVWMCWASSTRPSCPWCFTADQVAAFSRECLKRGLAVVVVGFPPCPFSCPECACISAGHTKGPWSGLVRNQWHCGYPPAEILQARSRSSLLKNLDPSDRPTGDHWRTLTDTVRYVLSTVPSVLCTHTLSLSVIVMCVVNRIIMFY
jgi:hypothetical protein